MLLLVGTSTTIFAQGGESEPPYGMNHLEAYSLFYENYRTGDYEMALTFGEWMLEAKPREIEGHRTFSLEDQFRRLYNVYGSLAEEETDPAEKERLYEQALNVFDITFETFDEDEIDMFQWTYRKGRFYQDHSSDISNAMQHAFEYYEKAYEMDKQRFAEMQDGYFAQILLGHYVQQDEDEKALAMIDEIEPYASAGLSQAITNAREEIFDAPEDRIGFLESQLEGSDNPEEILTELADLYQRVGDREKAVETAQKLYEINPSFENTRAMAEQALSNAQYGSAIDYLTEAAEKSPGEDQRKRLFLQISETYQNMDNLQSARDYARRAINIDSNYGAAYMQIASVYASAVSQCTSGRRIDRDDRTVYWLVLDYYEKAMEVDSSTRNAANRSINSYTPVMPTAEDKFFSGWETGDSFTIDGNVKECYGWINETTTVR